MRKIPIVFMSYARGDEALVARLSQDLRDRGAYVWVDVKAIEVGASIGAGIEEAIGRATHFCLAPSSRSVTRPWVDREYRTALTMQLSSTAHQPRILPLLLDDVEVPPLLRDIRYADFRRVYASGLDSVCRAMGLRGVPAPFVELLSILSHPEKDTYSVLEAALRKQDITASLAYQALKDGALQANAELNGQPAAHLPTVRRSVGGVSGTGSDVPHVLFVPSIKMRCHVYLSCCDEVESLYEINGAESFLMALSRFSVKIARRRLYVVPEEIEWVDDGSYPDGPGEERRLAFRGYVDS